MPSAVLMGDPVDRLPGNAHFTFPGCEGDSLLFLLDAAGVTAGTRVLEIGTGWGELAIRAARRGASVHTIPLAVEQLELPGRLVPGAAPAPHQSAVLGPDLLGHQPPLCLQRVARLPERHEGHRQGPARLEADQEPPHHRRNMPGP